MTPADRIAAAVRSCPAVTDLHGGAFGEVATYLPGRQVAGVRITGDPDATEPAAVGTVQVHVTGRYPAPVPEVARQVRVAVSAVQPSLAVEVTVEDYA